MCVGGECLYIHGSHLHTNEYDVGVALALLAEEAATARGWLAEEAATCRGFGRAFLAAWTC
jgi:hypothetical protein